MRGLVCMAAAIFFSISAYAQSTEQKLKVENDPRNYTTSTVDLTWAQPPAEPDGCRMKAGVLRCYKDNRSMAIDQMMSLDSGTVAFKNGTVITRKGEIIHLKNGDCINLFGAPEECGKKK